MERYEPQYLLNGTWWCKKIEICTSSFFNPCCCSIDMGLRPIYASSPKLVGFSTRRMEIRGLKVTREQMFFKDDYTFQVEMQFFSFPVQMRRHSSRVLPAL